MAPNSSQIQDLAKEIARIIEHGDVPALRRICTPDAQIWHNTDDTDMTVDQTVEFLQGMVGMTSRRWFSDVRLTPTESGFIHQHNTCAVYPDGKETRIPTCVVFTLDGGRIKRLEEYFDASTFASMTPQQS